MKYFVTLLISLIVIGCGSNFYLSKDYNFKKADNIHLAILPIGNEPNLTDTAFSKIFVDTTGFQEMTHSSEIRKIIFSNTNLLKIVNTITSKEYTNEELDEKPNLKKLLSDEDFKMLTSNLGKADVFLVPVGFNVSSSLGHTFGNYLFRLYDLHNGELIYEKAENINIDRSGPEAERYLTAFLIAMASTDYEKNYLNKVKGI